MTYNKITKDALRLLTEPPGKGYFLLQAFNLTLVAIGVAAFVHQVKTGMGVTGLNNPVGWGAYITTFVFWVGIAHSGTLISAILFLFRSKWRNAVYRLAEAMTVFAVLTAGLFPLIHLGRVWKFYWLFPFDYGRKVWINFRSPLVWDVFAVTTYLTVSSIFFFVGMLPDLATARDHTTGWRKKLYTLLSLGWQGSHKEWKNYRQAYFYFAAFATPLVISVHSVVSWDFAMSIVPGWHSTIFAPYFVAGAIFSGVAMVITILIPLRKIFPFLKDYFTINHLENLAKMMLLTGLIVGYAYAVEYYVVWYSGNAVEWEVFRYRAFGDYIIPFWIMVFCNAILPLSLFIKKIRRSVPALFVISLLVNVGMWFERFNIIVTSLAHEYIPHAWGLYKPSPVEMAIFAGSFGWFFFLLLTFLKLLPYLPVAELKEIQPLPRRGELHEEVAG